MTPGVILYYLYKDNLPVKIGFSPHTESEGNSDLEKVGRERGALWPYLVTSAAYQEGVVAASTPTPHGGHVSCSGYMISLRTYNPGVW